MTAKEQILSTVSEWADKQINSLVASNPRMSMFAPRLKQGLENYIDKNESKIDNMLLFVTDKDGKLDITDMFDEGMRMFQEMPVQTHKLMGLNTHVGQGAIEIKMPDNFLVSMFMGNTGSIKITTADIMELKQMLMAKAI